MIDYMSTLFIEGLAENDMAKLLAVPKSDIHNHSTKGCRRVWLEEQLKLSIPKTPKKYEGLDGMHKWFSSSIKPYCRGVEGIVLRWEGAFSETKRNHISRLAMNFGASEINLVGGLDTFIGIIESYHKKYCPDSVFEPEITYVSFCNPEQEAEQIEKYISTGYFKSIDVCGGENVQPFEMYLPLYRKVEQLNDIRKNGLNNVRR